MIYYKVLDDNFTPCNGGSGKWLPPGLWMPRVVDVAPCARGYHLCRRNDLIHWIGKNIYIAEARGDIIEEDNKIVCQSARLIKKLDTWNKISARLFACDCAERVIGIYEKLIHDDKRPHNAINTSRRYAVGQSSDDELAAAGAAARSAAMDAARDAVWAAARSAAMDAAWDPARDAAWAAARSAVMDAAWAAARSAAMDAARTAVRAAAWAAAWDAAWDAARDAAWAAARDAEQQWQTNRLFDYLEDRVDIEAVKLEIKRDIK